MHQVHQGGPRGQALAAWPDILYILLLAGLGAAFRLLYMSRVTWPIFNPVRHFALFQSILKGHGFTLLDGQPYIWHDPLWYYVAAASSRVAGFKATMFCTSLVSVPLLYLFLRKTTRTRFAAALGAALLAVSGPMIMFTYILGSDGFSLVLIVSALALASFRSSRLMMMASGLLIGAAIASRENFIYVPLLFLPFCNRKNILFFGAGLILPLAIAWVRNYLVILSNPYVFTLGGLAVKSSRFNLLSTLVVSAQPEVMAFAQHMSKSHKLFEVYFENPHSLVPIFLFMGAGGLAVILSRRLHLILAAGLCAITHILPPSGTISFLRHYIPLILIFFMAFAYLVDDYREKAPKKALAAGLLLAFFVAWTGKVCLFPDVMFEFLNPPLCYGHLHEDRYMVGSMMLNPEVLQYGYPDKKFIGMPLRPQDMEDFQKSYPEFRHILYMHCGPWKEWLQYLQDGVATGKYSVVRLWEDPSQKGCTYVVLKRVSPS